MTGLINKSAALGILLTSSAVIPLVLIGAGDFPTLGVALGLGILATCAYIFFTHQSRYTTFLYGMILALCACLFWRANPLLTFINTLAIFYVGSVMIDSHRSQSFSALDIVSAPFRVFFETLGAKNLYPFSVVSMKSRYQEKIGNPGRLIPAIALTILILLIIVPLLSSANPIFNELVTRVLQFFNLIELIQRLFSNPIAVLRWIVFFFLLFFVPRLMSIVNLEPKRMLPKVDQQTIALLIPKVAIILVLVVFFVTQLQLYFADGLTLSTLGYTNSKLTREVFGQLSLVVLIVFTLMYNDKNRDKIARATTWILFLEAVFLGLIAAKSDLDYIMAYGFTYKRLWGVVTVLWLFGTLKLYAWDYFKEKGASWFIQMAFSYAVVLLLTVNIVNFDYLIAHTNQPHAEGGVDYGYMAQLAPESDAYDMVLPKLIDNLQIVHAAEYSDVRAADILVTKIESIRREVEEGQWRSYTFAELEAYRKTRSLPLEQYRTIINDKYNSAVSPSFEIPDPSSTPAPSATSSAKH